MLTQLSSGPRVVGAKQVKRALETGSARQVFLASDADPRVTAPLAELCREKNVPVEQVGAMAEIGRACGIAVGSAVAALLDA